MSVPDTRAPHASRQLRLAASAVCAAAIIPYLPVVGDFFIRDDFGTVQLLASKPAGYFPRWFYTSWMDNIWGFNADEVRPFPALSYQLTALAGAGSPVGHHLFNIALHAANGLLVLAIALRVAGLGLPAAAFAALVFVLLPVSPESVAWITGRVDSMPAFFYLASFLAYALWRGGRGAPLYLASLALFFVALFTKQTTITMVGTLAAFDALLARKAAGSLQRRAVVYLPFAAFTAGYLALRFVMFGQAAREERLTAQGLREFAWLVDRHLAHVVIGDPDGSRVLVWLIVATLAVVCLYGARDRRDGRSDAGVLLFFGPAWWILGVAPVLVAGYESPRHAYLAAAGWAIVLGLAFEILQTARADVRWRRAMVAAAGIVVFAYAFMLQGVVRDWRTMAMVSERGVRDLGRESLAAPQGALLIVGVPARSWEWALPFAATPPFSETDLTRRSFIISPWLLHCCRQQWLGDTKRTLAAWSAGSARDGVVVMRWDPDTGALSRLSQADQPSLPDIARALMGVDDPDLLDRAIRRLLDSLP